MFTKHGWKVLVIMIMALSIMCAATVADCKAWKPEKSVTIVVPYGAGGSTDLLARAVEKVWSKYCPQPVQIVNKTAGGGVEGSTFVARSKPDGSTLVIGYGSGCDLVMPHIQKVEYDPFKDLEPIARLSVHSVLVAVPEKSPFQSLKDVIEYGKKGQPVTAAVSTTAGAVDIVMRGIGKTAGINVIPIPHTGGGPAVITLVGGHTIIGGGHPAEIIGPLKSGKIRAIAIATPQRDPALPDVPTLIEQGINFSTWGSVKGIAIAKNTPQPIIDYYANLFKKISKDPEFKKTMQDMLQPIMYLGPADFKKFMKQAFDDYGKLIKDLGLDKK
jgi:tripartite-type tricarboxylate transporter receptor subunit TctC